LDGKWINRERGINSRLPPKAEKGREKSKGKIGENLQRRSVPRVRNDRNFEIIRRKQKRTRKGNGVILSLGIEAVDKGGHSKGGKSSQFLRLKRSPQGRWEKVKGQEPPGCGSGETVKKKNEICA